MLQHAVWKLENNFSQRNDVQLQRRRATKKIQNSSSSATEKIQHPSSSATEKIPHPPSSLPSLSSLPDEIILRCLALVPRSYHLSLSWVSKHLRSLVLSLPELNKLRSIRHKKSLYVFIQNKYNDPTVSWFTLRPTDETATDYGLVPNLTPFPSHPNKYGSSTVVVGPNIYFIGGSTDPSTDLWILDTQSGNMSKGPSMSVPREKDEAAVGMIDGKIYVIRGGGFPKESFRERIQVEVYDPESETWEIAGPENVRSISRCSASVERKVYMVDYEEIDVYNPRGRERERMVHMVTQRLEGGRKDRLNDIAYLACVVEDVLYAFFDWDGFMWFNTKLNVWRRLLDPDGKELPFILRPDAMAEYDDGKLVVLYMLRNYGVDGTVRCMLVSLHRAGDMICGTVDWSGIVGTVPYSFYFLHCLAVSD